MTQSYHHTTTESSRKPTRSTRHWRETLRHDLPASFVVFLIAIPLSLGIAAASGAPLIAGLVAAVVGGVVAGALGGSPLQVSGPAAGMTVVVAGTVDQFGWPATAAITLAAGLVQILLGVTRIGRLALSLSPAVVHGMLAGIGVTIVVGQLRVLLGGNADASVLANVRNLPDQLLAPDWSPALVGVITIGTLLLWPRMPWGRVVPAPLVAVVAATASSILIGLDVVTVSLPDDPLAEMSLPQLPGGGAVAIAFAVLTVAMVASVESLLSAVAVDKMHDGPRSNLDRELVGQGAANAVSGALGGLPITGVIVRSSTNVAAGARSRASSILHGVWIAVFVLALGSVLELIPMAALAGVLIVMGAKLVHPGHMRDLRRHGELAVYGITMLGVVVFGLMQGVALGMVVAVVRALYRLTHNSVKVGHDDLDGLRVVVHGSLVFLGVGKLVRELRRIEPGHHIVLELHVDFMDHAAFEAIDDWRASYERTGGRVDVDEYHDQWYGRARDGEPGRQKKSLPSPLPRWFAPWAHWARMHADETSGSAEPTGPPEKGELVLGGMHEFHRQSAPLVRPFLAELAERGQSPNQLFITCADSRVVPNLITSTGPGDQFCVRNIGNLVPPYHEDEPMADSSVGAAIEFAVDVLDVPTIVVCGHSDCGAMKALVRGNSSPGSRLHSWLRNGRPSLDRLSRRSSQLAANGNGDGTAEHDLLCVANVAQQLDNLRTYPSVVAAEQAGRLRLVGMYFDLTQARFYLVDGDTGHLEPVRRQDEAHLKAGAVVSMP